MRRRPINSSAALALAIERQVEEILTKAKASCASYSGFAGDDTSSGPQARPAASEPKNCGKFEGAAHQTGPAFPASEPPRAPLTPTRATNFWNFLRSVGTRRRFG
jgi:hypothetical protein